MSPAVIGAGWGRTGTTSLKNALEILGFGPCHHMHEVLDHREQVAFFQAAVDGDEVDWDMLFATYNSAVDWPVSAFWRELAEHYPDARFVLSLRDEESWWQSFSRTILVQLMAPKNEADDPAFFELSQMVDKLVIERVFQCAPDDKDAVLARYRAHIDEVRESLPTERLLIVGLGDGWGPLCRFLQCPVPAEPYPLLNTSSDYAKEKLE